MNVVLYPCFWKDFVNKKSESTSLALDMSNGGENLLVFGYSCKLFRDDERALAVDAGHYLIPWMGSEALQIDRFDGRGHLHNLEAFEPREDDDEELGPTPEEKAEERLCEEERYQALHEAVEAEREEETRQQEKERRRGAQVGFDYGSNDDAAAVTQAQRQEAPSLHVLANCIEKTAEFIASQGAQMEILMRAKEADNLKFQFLNPDNPYHVIYKQVLAKKRARPKNYASLALAQQQQRQAALAEVEKSLQMLKAQMPSAAPLLTSSADGEETSSTTSSSNNAYSKLVERIRENQKPLTPPQQQVQVSEEQPQSPKKEEGVVEVIPPPITMQPLIDKTASYVAKNGTDMLAVVKKRDPEGFAFLNPTNKYNLFYQYKVTLYREILAEQNSGSSLNNGSNTDQTEQMPAAAAGNKFPTLKGFFR